MKQEFYCFVLFAIIILNPSYTEAQTITDIDGNKYPFVKIGSQTWTQKNLEVTRFRNGDEIPEAKSLKKWDNAGNEGKPAWCYYGYNAENGIKYGKLYNYYAISDPRGITPEGWHVPTDLEWTMLTDTLGGAILAGDSLKCTYGWDLKSDNITGLSTNQGFCELPGGICNHSGGFYGIGDIGAWWSSSWSREDIAWSRNLYFNSKSVSRDGVYKRVGLSVRLVKD